MLTGALPCTPPLHPTPHTCRIMKTLMPHGFSPGLHEPSASGGRATTRAVCPIPPRHVCSMRHGARGRGSSAGTGQGSSAGPTR